MNLPLIIECEPTWPLPLWGLAGVATHDSATIHGGAAGTTGRWAFDLAETARLRRNSGQYPAARDDSTHTPSGREAPR